MTGGSSQLVVDLVERLGSQYEQHVLTSYIPTPESYVNIPITEIRQGTSAQELAVFMRSMSPDLLHVHYWGEFDEPWYESVFRAAASAGIRLIENVNTPVAPFLSTQVQRYVFVSDYVQSTFGSGLEDRSLRVYPGSDFAKFRREGQQPVPDDCVGMVYRLETDKLNKSSIDPFIEIVRRRPSTRALIVGGGSLLESFREAVLAAGIQESFTFTGYVAYQQLQALYAQMSVFLAPVWKESFGQVGPFAMSMEIPIVGFEVGGLPEMVGDPELCAPPGDSVRLADIAVRLLDDRPRRLEIGRRNRVRAESQFSIEGMIESYHKLYTEVLANVR